MRRFTDDELAAAVAAGDQRAFGVVFERYHEPLYRYCLSILRDRELAADALQNTMIAALRGLEGEERAIALRPWLYRIAHNQSISLIRRRRDDEPLEGAALVTAAAGVDSATRARLEELLGDMRELPDQQRSALLLRELSGLEYEEVGSTLAITSNAARQAVFKARRSLEAVAVGREARCEVVQSEMSANDRRFQRRRDISAHLEGCADCRAFATALTQRPRDLAILFPALPAATAAALAGAPKPGGERRRRSGVLVLLLLGLALAATALAASDAFEGDGGGGRRAAAVTRPPAKPTSDRSDATGASGSSSAPAGAPSGSAGAGGDAQAAARARTPEEGSGRVVVPSAATAYSTPGERTEGIVNATADCAARGSGSGASSGTGTGSSGGSGSAGGAGGSSGSSATIDACAGAGGGGGLPVTGLAIGAVLAVALMLLATGLALRRLTPETRRR